MHRDRLLYQGTFEQEGPEGAWWLSSGDELLCRTNTGIWKRINDEVGVYLPPVDRIRIESDRVLWVFDDENRFATRLELTSILQRQRQKDDLVQLHHFRRQTTDGVTSVFWGLRGGEHLTITTKSFERRIPLPNESRLARQEEVSIFIDSHRYPWIIGHRDDDPTCYWDGEDWRVFEQPANNDPSHALRSAQTSFEVACEDAWRRNHPRPPSIPGKFYSFEQGFVVHMRRKFAVYHGDRWHRDRFLADSFPMVFQSVEWQGDLLRGMDFKKKWHEVELAKLPNDEEERAWPWRVESAKRTEKKAEFALPEISWVDNPQKFPSPFEKPDWKVEPGLHFSGRKLAWGPEGYPWVVQELPAGIHAKEVHHYTTNQRGDLMLYLHSSRIERALVVRARDSRTRVDIPQLDVVRSPRETIPIEVESEELDHLWIRCAVDEMPWSTWSRNLKSIQVPCVAHAGVHRLKIQLWNSDHLDTLGSREWRFTASYEIKHRLAEWLQMLESSQPKEREMAFKEIEKLGPCVVYLLPQLMENSSREVRFRLKTSNPPSLRTRGTSYLACR